MDAITLVPNDEVVVPSREELIDRFTSYDYSIFVVMLACSGAIGLYCAFAAGPQRTTRQLLAADGRLPPTFVSMSLMASFISAAFILGNAAEVYQNGTIIVVTVFSYVLMLAATASWFVPIFYELGVHTCYQYLELRFSRSIRVTAVFIYVIEMLIYMGISLYAPALAISNLTGITLWTAVCAIGLVCTVYTSVGGIKAVVYTDTFQAIIMLGAMAAVVIYGFAQLGGITRVWKIAQQGDRIQFIKLKNSWVRSFSFDPTVRHTVWGLVIGAAISNAGLYATNNMMVLRYFTVSSLEAAKKVVWINLPLLALILILSCLSGVLMYARYHDCDPIENRQISTSDQLFPYFIMDSLGTTTGMAGLFVAGLFAASLSSISSAVNALSNVFYIDIILLLRPDISADAGAKVIVVLGVVFGLLSIALVAVAESMGQVMAATLAVNAGLGAPLFGLFSSGIFFPTVTNLGAFAGLFVSLPISLYLNMAPIITGVQTFTPTHLTLKGCSGSFAAANYSSGISEPTPIGENIPFLYRLSYLWTSLISVVVHIFVSLLVSKISGSNNPKKMNPNLICRPFDQCPCISDKIKKMLNFHVGEEFRGMSHVEADKVALEDIMGSVQMKRADADESSEVSPLPSESDTTVATVSKRSATKKPISMVGKSTAGANEKATKSADLPNNGTLLL